jgi:hypothetical protein
VVKIRRQPLQKTQKTMLNKIMAIKSGRPADGGSAIADRSSIIKLTATKYGKSLFAFIKNDSTSNVQI